MGKKKAKYSKAGNKNEILDLSAKKKKVIDAAAEDNDGTALASLLGIIYHDDKTEGKEEKRPYEVVAVKKLLTEAPPQHHFIVSDGSVIKSVIELIDAFEKMHADTYKFHANEHKNDFSNWVKDVFGEHKLAESLKSAASKIEAQLAVAKTLLNELLL